MKPRRPASRRAPAASGAPGRRRGLEWRRLPDRLLAFDPASGALHTLDPHTGGLFLLCDGRRPAVELARRLASRRGWKPAAARAWVAEGLRALGAAGLLVDGGDGHGEAAGDNGGGGDAGGGGAGEDID